MTNPSIEFLTKIIKDNRLHESHCPSFSTTKGEFSGIFGSMLEKYCHCWLDSETTSEPGTGFGHYSNLTKEVENRVYPNRFSAYQDLIQGLGYSADPESDSYWEKHYLITPVTYTPAHTATESDE